jgi:hypothetical protein
MLPNPDEMPGALEEIAPSPPSPPYYGDSLDLKFTERAQVMQAWGNYGLVWPVVHQRLGISPDLGMGAVEVVPQVPDGQPSVAGRDIKLGDGSIPGSIAVKAVAGAKRFTVTVDFKVRRLPSPWATRCRPARRSPAPALTESPSRSLSGRPIGARRYWCRRAERGHIPSW